MEKGGTDYIEGQADAADDQDDLGACDGFELDEAFDRLHGDAQAEGKEKGAIEEGSEELSARPAEG